MNGFKMEAHDRAVSAIQMKVQQFSANKQPFRIYHGSTNSTRDSRRSLNKDIDTSMLRNVLHINEEKKTATVEPNVAMDELLQATIRCNLVPLVVMEFPGITVGGGYSGTSGESSSFRHGFFEGCVNWADIVAANGTTVRASRTENSDLFWGAASSFGTFGVVTLLEIQLKDAAQYVELTYLPVVCMRDAVQIMEAETAKPGVDFLDGIVYSKTSIVVCSGRFAASVPAGATIQHFTRRYDPWFYTHVQRRMKNVNLPVAEYVPLVDYLFRYDRGGFWVARYAYRYFLMPFNRITRFLLDHFMHTRVMYHALHASGLSRMYIVQDVAVPYNVAETFTNWLDEEFAIYPLWICPLRQRRANGDPSARYGLLADLADPSATPEFMMNFGVWGPGSKIRAEFVRQNRALENKVDELSGRKWLYAHAYYTEDEFWSRYDRKSYDALREKYGASYLLNIYDKVKVVVEDEETVIHDSSTTRLASMFWSTWPLSGLYGVYKALVGGNYILQRKPERQ